MIAKGGLLASKGWRWHSIGTLQAGRQGWCRRAAEGLPVSRRGVLLLEAGHFCGWSGVAEAPEVPAAVDHHVGDVDQGQGGLGRIDGNGSVRSVPPANFAVVEED